jgi:hypothetical protein
VKRHWEIIADNLSKTGWSWGLQAQHARNIETLLTARPWGGEVFTPIASHIRYNTDLSSPNVVRNSAYGPQI